MFLQAVEQTSAQAKHFERQILLENPSVNNTPSDSQIIFEAAYTFSDNTH